LGNHCVSYRSSKGYVFVEVGMKVYQIAGYPKNYYFVKNFSEFLDIMSWMIKNDVKFLQKTSSGIHGYGFSVEKNIEWFLLRWA
jgi:transcription antitermination factor NusG